MRKFFALLFAFFMAGLAHAQQPDPAQAADHTALRQLLRDAVQSVNQRDYALAEKIIHKPFMATLVTQDHFTGIPKLKAYFEALYTRPMLQMKKIVMSAEADDLSQIYQGTFALTKGATKERYELADGRAFDLGGRWTGVSIKDNGTWKLLAVHMGTNFLDNPVINAIEKSLIWFTLGGLLLGVVLGVGTTWLMMRRKRALAP